MSLAPMSICSKTWFNAYQFGSGNDYDTRDPKTWKLYGSNDGTTWEFLDYQDLTNKFPQRKTLYTFFLRSQAKAYHMIKLQICMLASLTPPSV